MTEIIALLQCLDQSLLDKTTHRRLSTIVFALLAMTGRVTMLGISRWAGEGGSYRTIQRFFNTDIVWPKLLCAFVNYWFVAPEDTFLLAADETVVGKAGTTTFGLDRFFSSLAGKSIPSLAFLAFSLISVQQRRSSVLRIEQLQKGQFSKQPVEVKAETTPKNKGGRPKGSKNKNRRDMELPLHLQVMQKWLKEILALLKMVEVQVNYFVFDGALGNNNALQMASRCGLHLISKLRSDAAIFFPYKAAEKQRGSKRKYGQRVRYDQIPSDYLKSSQVVEQIRTNIYQMQVWHQFFPDKLNVVVVWKTNLKTQKSAYVVLFSSDLYLEADKMVDYYRLRFQIEFNFRDAKQFWGLEDFMNTKECSVYNAANLAMFMVNISQVLRQQMRGKISDFGIHDLKAHYRGRKYVAEILKLLPEKPKPVLIEELFVQLGALGSVHVAP